MILVNSPLAVGKKVFRAIIITRELYLRVKLIFANYNISKRFMSKTIHTRNFNENFSKNSGRVFPTKVKTQSRKTSHRSLLRSYDKTKSGFIRHFGSFTVLNRTGIASLAPCAIHRRVCVLSAPDQCTNHSRT